jgi:hypothetical protein
MYSGAGTRCTGDLLSTLSVQKYQPYRGYPHLFAGFAQIEVRREDMEIR